MRHGSGAHYVTSIDRAGLALGVGGVLAGFVAVLLLLAGGQRDGAALAAGWVLGVVFAMAGIVAVAGPIWLGLHLAGRRGPAAAALTGGLVALLLFTAGQSWGLDPFEPSTTPVDSSRVLAAAATSLGVALAAAAIGWTMQRVAYRRVY